MKAIDEIKRVIGSARISFQGGEPNWIPQGGLTLSEKELALARKWKHRPASDFKDESVINQFETSFNSFLSTSHAYSFSSGRAALLAILKTFEFQTVDKILMPGYSCIAVANSIWFSGTEPVFYDIELESYGVDFEDVKKKYAENSGIKAIVLQHTYGLIGKDFIATLEWAKQNSLVVIEDCAHSLGSTMHGQMAGTFGDAAFFSFERSKCISTFQGGMATIKDPTMADKLKSIQKKMPFPENDQIIAVLDQFIFTYLTERDKKRWYLRPFHFWMNQGKYIPGNSSDELQRTQPANYLQRLSAPLAQIGLSQLSKLRDSHEIRRSKGEEWRSWAHDRGYKTPTIINGSDPCLLVYPIRVPSNLKDDLSWSSYLRAEIGKWYISHLHPTDYDVSACPNAEIAISECINLPTNLATIL